MGCIALILCVLVLRCGLAGVVWYPYTDTTHAITQRISRKFLRMDVLTSEACWALNNEIIKQVTSSWSLFIQLTKNSFKKRVQISNWRNSDLDKENDSCKTCKAYEHLTKPFNCMKCSACEKRLQEHCTVFSKIFPGCWHYKRSKNLEKHEKIRWK